MTSCKITCRCVDLFKEDMCYTSLSVEEVEEIISDNMLNVSDERIVFEALVSWVNGDLANRVQLVPRLLRCCRLALIEKQYFNEVVQVQR